MATQADVRRIARALPGTVVSSARFAFEVPVNGKLKGFVWAWRKRIDARKPKVPQTDVVVLRVASLTDKEFLLGLDAEKFFTEPHYDGYPAVLVRLAAVKTPELRALIREAWRCLAETPPTKPRRRTRVKR